MFKSSHADSPANRRISGFTLIELVIVMVVIGIIAAIAYPSYVESLNKAKRSEGKAAMSSIAQSLERCFTRHNAYNHASCPNGTVQSESGYYSISINAASATSYSIQAQPNFSDSRCGQMTMNHQGQRTSNDNSYCW